MLALKSAEKIDKSVFSGLNEQMKRRIENSVYCAVNDENNDFIQKFSARVYIPENVRIDEKIPRFVCPYFIIRSMNRLFGVESLVNFLDSTISSNEISRSILLTSPFIYIPQVYDIPDVDALDTCNCMILNFFDIKMKRITDVDPMLPKITFSKVVFDDPHVIRVDSTMDL